jgi:hypothetical protein
MAPPRNYSLYVYLYELGVRLLKPGRLLSYIVTNKRMKACYPSSGLLRACKWARSQALSRCFTTG